MNEDYKRKGVVSDLLEYAYAQENKSYYVLGVLKKNEDAKKLYINLVIKKNRNKEKNNDENIYK